MNRDRHNAHSQNNRHRQHLRRVLLTVILGSPGVANAQMPTGADVVAGQAAISQAGNLLNVDTATSRAIVNWDSFNVGAGNVANFNLPDANSAIMNRVTSGNMPSTIDGAVNSNGHVFLVNPSGIVVSSSGMVNTNGFTASTFDVANQDFLAGGALTFTDGGSSGSIVNAGTIATGKSGAHLIANDIANSGTITSSGGSITLSGGGSVTLENGATYVQPTMETLASGISPTAGLIQNTGTIRATGAATSGGEVYLVNPNGKILHDGTIAAHTVSNVVDLVKDPGTDGSLTRSTTESVGGHVQLEADDITLAAGSTIDASGTLGGGEVLVGGDWQGSGEMSQATTVTMEGDTLIDASAIESGDGGTIVLWSDITNADSNTQAAGNLIARAGDLSGDGGQIETSGASVNINGLVVDAGAANGSSGLWLIDPHDYTIDATSALAIASALNQGSSVSVSTGSDDSAFGGSALNDAEGDITIVANIITGAMTGDASLTLKAHRHIIVNPGTVIDATQNGNTAKLDVKLWADTDNSGDGINIISSPTIATNGGSLTFGNGNTATIGGVATQVGGDLYINGVTTQLFDTAGGDITVNGETILANASGVTFASAGGDVLFGGVLNSGNQYTYVDGPDGQSNSWEWARGDAKNGTTGGSAVGDSYMVTITSRLENAIAGIAAGYRGAWIGAYRDTSTPNDWLWADGPEAGQHFFTQAEGGGTATSGSYSNFGSGEPNGSGTGGESVGQFFGTAGQWNDLNPSTTFSSSQDSVYSVLGYVRETNLSPSAMTIDVGTGSVQIDGGVGGSKALSSFDVTAATTTINGDSLVTTGAQNYSSALNATSTVGLAVDGTTLTTNGALSLSATGNIEIDADLISTLAGTMNFYGPTVVLSDLVLTASDSEIILHGNVNSDGTARSLTVNPGAADATFGGTVGGSSALSALTVNGTAKVNADITTSGTQTWTNTITIGGSGTRTLTAGTLNTQAIVGGSNDIALIADDLNLGGNVASTGSLLIAPKTAGTDIGVGNIAGTFSFNNTDFSRLEHGFSSVTIGNSAAGHLMVGGITSLVDDLTLRAGSSSDLFVNDSLSWSSDDALTLAAGQDIFVNSDIDVAGSAAALNLFYGGTDGSSAPTSNYDYYIDVANQRHIQFDAASAGLKIGNESFTLLDSVSGLQGMAAGGRYALVDDLSLAGTSYTDAFYTDTFAGKLDGLGNEVDGLTVRANDGGNYGLFGLLDGASIRHLGVTNVDLLGQSTSNAATNDLRIGGIVGNASGSGTNLLDGVWSTGVIATKQGSQQDVFYAGGLVGGHDSGTLNILRSFSTVNVSSQGSHSGKMSLGGLLGDSGDENGISGIGGSAQNLLIDRSYSTGSIVEGTYDEYYGSGGLVGVIYGDVATLTDSFSRSNVVGGFSSGGIAGFSNSGTTQTYQNLYTTLDRFGNGTVPSQSYKSDTLAAATNNGTQLPSGWSSDTWTAGEFPTLKAVGVPASLLYVKVIGGTGVYGDLATPTYQIVDADGNTISFGTGDYSNLSGVTGTGRYTLDQFTNAGTYNSVSYLSGLGLTGDDANLYALNPFTTAGSFTVAPRSITAMLSATGVSKVYDGNVNAGSGYSPTWSFTNIVSGDSATLDVGSSFFNDADVLDANLFTINGLYLAGITSTNGALISDYVLANTTANVAANITAKPIVVNGLFANDKIYDGNTTGSIDSSSVTYSGLVSGDFVTLSDLGGTFADKNVAAGKVVTVTGSFTGTDASNYDASLPTTLAADITPKSITTSGITSSSRIYDGTSSAIVDATGINFDGMVSGDTLTATGTVGSYDDKNVDTGKIVRLSGSTYGGADVGNYDITGQSTTTSDVTAKAIIVSGLTAENRVYNGTTTATVDYSGVTFTGIVSGDNLTAGSTSGAFADKNVANGKAVTLSGTAYGGTDASNYTFTDQTSSAANITPKSIAVSGITAANRVYDGTTDATVDITGLTFSGIVAGDDLTASGTSGVFGDKNVDSHKAVSLSGTTYGGTDLANYNIADQGSTTADITAKSIIVSGLQAVDRTYDGTDTTTVDHTGVKFGGIVAGDNLTVNNTIATFADKNVGVSRATALSDSTYGGTDVGNYTFTDQTASTATITAKSITVSGLAADDRVYNAGTHATVDHTGVTFNGIVTGDNLTASGTTGTFADKHVGGGKSVALSGTNYGGADLNNYDITDQTSATAMISTLAVSVAGVIADSKVYDSNTTATLSGTASVNTLGGDDVSLTTNYIANFADTDVGSGRSVTVDSFALSGSDASNYTLSQPSGLSADITPATLTVIANADSKFVTKTDIVGYAGATFNGFVGSEGIADLGGSLSIARNGTDEAAGTYTSVLSASGLTSSNYDITFVDGNYTIVPAEQFLIRFGNSSSTYGDSLGFNFLSAEYMDAGNNVATLLPTVNGNDYSFDDGVGGTAQFTIGLDGASLSTGGHANAGNYDLTMGNMIASGGNFSNNINLFGTHSINRANLAVGAGGVSKTYDGTALMNNLTLNLTGIVAGDAVKISGQGSYSDRNAGTGLSYTVANLTLKGDDSNNYALPDDTVLSDTNGIINAKSVTINAPTVTKVYDGDTNFDPTATQLQSWTDALAVTGDSVDGITLTFNDKNVGAGKTLTPSAININDGNNGGNYDVTFNNDTASSITRLSSVTWIGGASGDWNDPANWAGGAIPDLANVANVVIPAGVTPTFGTNVAGPVELDSFSGGNLQLDGGTLDVFDLFDADALTQSGGTLEAGNVSVTDFAQNAGSLQVDNKFTVTNTFTQSTFGAIDVGGTVEITHTGGTLTVNDLSGGNITLDSTAGGVHLNQLQSTRTLTVEATGDITQDNFGTLSVAGTTSITTDDDINLGGPNNDFVGPVSLDATIVTIHDSTGGLVLGNVDTTGSLYASTTSGDITQSSTSQIKVGTKTTLSADGDIDLSGGSNQFTSTVDLDANNAEITQTVGDLILGTVDIVNQLVTDVAGKLKQTGTSTIIVGGTTTLNSVGPIELTGTGNDFRDAVTVNAPRFQVQSATPLTIIRTGAALAREVGIAANAETINDTLVRPAKSTDDSTKPVEHRVGWVSQFSSFINNLFQRPTLEAKTNDLVPANVKVQKNDVFILGNSVSDSIIEETREIG